MQRWSVTCEHCQVTLSSRQSSSKVRDLLLGSAPAGTAGNRTVATDAACPHILHILQRHRASGVCMHIKGLTDVMRNALACHTACCWHACMHACLLSASSLVRFMHGSNLRCRPCMQVHESLRRHQTSIQCRAAQADGPSNRGSNAAVPTNLGLTPSLQPPPPPQQQQHPKSGSAPHSGGGGRQTRSRAAMPKAAAAGVLPPTRCLTCHQR
jgi:hypothetical protein